LLLLGSQSDLYFFLGLDPVKYENKWASILRHTGVLASIEGAPLKLKGFRWQHPFR
jgi:hypothetical protein